jgi:hypothetical protein
MEEYMIEIKSHDIHSVAGGQPPVNLEHNIFRGCGSIDIERLQMLRVITLIESGKLPFTPESKGVRV